MGSAYESFTSSKYFELDTRDPCLDIHLNDSTELWLIQWPRKELKPQDFDGEEFKVKLHHDGKIGSLKNSSGKSYEMVSYEAQIPDAQVFLPTSSESKFVGKFARRVSIVPDFDLEEYKNPSIFNPNLSSQRGSTARSSQNKSSMSRGRSYNIALAHSMEMENRKAYRKRSGQNNEYQSNDISSRGSRPESQVTEASVEISKDAKHSAETPEVSRRKGGKDQVSDVSNHSEEKPKKKKSKKEKS